MTETQKAKEQIRDLQEILELIKEFEIEVREHQNTVNYCKLMKVEPAEHIVNNLKESTELLNHNIDRWNELTNTKLTKVTE